MELTPPQLPPSAKRLHRRWPYAVVGLLVLLSIAGWFGLKKKPTIQVALSDGRILVIEEVTYGKHHRVGHPSRVLNRLRPWIPELIYRRIAPTHPESQLDLDHPALVIWVNALDATTGTNIDCQMLRTELVSRKGDLFQGNAHWYGEADFWRVGHVFYAWPQDEPNLTLRVTPYRKNESSTLKLANPHIATPQPWTGRPVPQSKEVGEYELVLSGLQSRTNGDTKQYWVTPAAYWEPQFELHRFGQSLGGWADPEWNAEDPLGNRGKFLGIHQPVVKFSASVYPDPTNVLVAPTIAALPPIDLSTLQTNLWWNRPLGSTNLLALGVCPPGVRSFSGGELDLNPVSKMGAVRGGAPSGWTGARKQINPLQTKTTHAHYSHLPTIYIRATALQAGERLAIRLKDDQGHVLAAKPESQGSSEGIFPFLLDLPAGLTNITAELAILKPVQAEFYVETSSRPTP